MKITLVRSMARSAVFELVNSGCYRAPAPYTAVSYTHLTLPTIA